MGGFKSNSKAWLNSEEAVLKRTVRNMMTVTTNRAYLLAPFDTGDLVGSGRVEGNGSKYTAIYGGADRGVPYARIHELGGRTGRNYSVTITAKHYLKKAGDSVFKKEGVKKYYNMSK